MSEVWDVVVVGAGAAGLMAAARAAELSARTLLLEKNRRPGVKILMSGGTRCNLTHATDNRGIVEAYGPPGRFLHSALAAFGVEETLALFEREGVAVKVEETGKVFPVSDSATDVLNALLRRLQRSGAILVLDEALREIEREADRFLLQTIRQTRYAKCVILTTGGRSYPRSGTTGDGYAWAERFGHTIVPPRPALVPITVSVPWVAQLRGVTLSDVAVRIVENQKPLIRRRGSLLFAHFGLSGPVILDVSRVVSGHREPMSLVLELDFVPTTKEQQLDEALRQESAREGKKLLAAVLTHWVPRRLAEMLLEVNQLPTDRRAAALSKAERIRLVASLKRTQLPISGTLGFGRAEVTAGGVALNEVDSRTMQSKLVPGLYLAGELLDLDGPIGGYNFQAAWSTGWLAGDRAARAVNSSSVAADTTGPDQCE